MEELKRDAVSVEAAISEVAKDDGFLQQTTAEIAAASWILMGR